MSPIYGRAGIPIFPVKRLVARVATMAVSFLAASEIGLRLYNPFPFRVRGDHIVLPVHQSYAITHVGATKLDPVTRVTKNSLGFRGPEPPRDWANRLTILTIGGSTTENLFLSDGKTWTDQLTRRLAVSRPDAWVNNAGFEGHSTFGHLVLLREYIVAMRPRVALFLTGYNDMLLPSARPIDRALNPENLGAGHRMLTWMADHSQVAAVGENFLRMFRTYRAGVDSGELKMSTLKTRRLDEEKAEWVLGDHRTKYLAPFARRLAEIVTLCRQNGIEPVLVTQPALYGDLVDPTTGIDLANTAIGPVSNGRVEWMALELYNDQARQLSAAARVHLIDLARAMPKDSKYFADWVHYTNDGARLVGDIVFAGLDGWLPRADTH